jgi:hypothetical protein
MTFVPDVRARDALFFDSCTGRRIVAADIPARSPPWAGMPRRPFVISAGSVANVAYVAKTTPTAVYRSDGEFHAIACDCGTNKIPQPQN